MNQPVRAALALAAATLATQAMAQITLYENDNWHGPAYSADGPVHDLTRQGFNDRASSVVVDDGRWEVCDDTGFRGHCVVLRRGSYASPGGMGLDSRIFSVRPVAMREHYDNEAPPPLPEATYIYRRRPHETIYDVPVQTAHAVVGPPEQRCWIDREQVSQPRNNAGGTIAGAVIGGILGHQIGGGAGRAAATAGGAIAGAAVGANVGSGADTYERDVRRCDQVASTTPAYWDVTYTFRGVEHHVQMTNAPGSTIAVNGNGEPRL